MIAKKKTILKSEKDLLDFGERIGQRLKAELQKNPEAIVIELVGDVGAGKTTLTRGIAKGLGINAAITSPSFTISKQYAFKLDASKTQESLGTLVHYDFYRLDEPGLMMEDLAEMIQYDNTVVIVEWGDSIAEVLPEKRTIYNIYINDDESRLVVENKNETLS
ncbi:tRNA (adenosine(37)-N6)-threonylcarbamoyltransferase complex ATPase subunit type 1 TsaE [Candidatus Saccharibacteria bacterium]|nr:tRNA (adenosine(37)-N6)-threonylcarbamoyltransferase complex ATPase subunit type 1 TsaE [Candidatus Saccharibacteria bacterium]